MQITQENILATRQHFIDAYKGAIEDARAGRVFVNDLDKYIRWQEAKISATAAGMCDHTLTFWQRAHWIQTGECLPILP